MLEKLIEIANSWQSEVAVIFGMILQFFLSEKKTYKILFTIIGASVLMAIYVIPTLVDVLHIKHHSNVERSLYAISSLLSIEMLALIMVIVPKGIGKKLRKVLDIEKEE